MGRVVITLIRSLSEHGKIYSRHKSDTLGEIQAKLWTILFLLKSNLFFLNLVNEQYSANVIKFQ